MKNVIKTALGLCAIGGLLLLLISAAGVAQADKGWPYDDLDEVTQPEVPKLKSFSGDIFKGFGEFRVQRVTFSAIGIAKLEGEPFEQLVNISNIIRVHRFEDRKKTDYSCLMFIYEGKHPNGCEPILVRETYETVIKRMKRATEAR